MAIKTGRRGPFLACTAYPKCKNAKPLPEGIEGQVAASAPPKSAKPAAIETEIKCENCGKPMLLRAGRYGHFLGCSGYPKCKTIVKPDEAILGKYLTPVATE